MPSETSGRSDVTPMVAPRATSVGVAVTGIEKTRLCKFNAKGKCQRGLSCTFAHGRAELQQPPDLYKTRLCSSLQWSGVCAAGADCTFAHSQAELRPAGTFGRRDGGVHTGGAVGDSGVPPMEAAASRLTVSSSAGQAQTEPAQQALSREERSPQPTDLDSIRARISRIQDRLFVLQATSNASVGGALAPAPEQSSVVACSQPAAGSWSKQTTEEAPEMQGSAAFARQTSLFSAFSDSWCDELEEAEARGEEAAKVDAKAEEQEAQVAEDEELAPELDFEHQQRQEAANPDMWSEMEREELVEYQIVVTSTFVHAVPCSAVRHPARAMSFPPDGCSTRGHAPARH